MNMLRNIFAVAMLALACLPAQDHGRVGARLTFSGIDYQLRQISRGAPTATDNLLGLWPMSVDVLTAPPAVTLTMPFDVPTALLVVGNDNFLVCGRNRATNTGFLCRVTLTAGPLMSLADVVALTPGVTYSQLAQNTTEGMLYGLRYEDPVVDAGTWSLASPLPVMTATTSIATAITTTGIVDVGEVVPARFQGLSSTGVVLASSYPNSPAESRLWLRQESTGWAVTTFTPTNALTTINTCATEYPGFQDNDGPVLFRGRAGFAQLMDTESGVIVGSASVTQDWQITPYSLLQPLAVGRSYRPLGVNCTGADFWPTFRAGGNTELSGHKMGLGEFAQRDFFAGNPDFALWARVRHAPNVVDMPGHSLSFMWVKLGEPTPANLVVMPGGEVLIADPDATLGPSPYDAPMVEGQNFVHFPLSLVGTEQFVGQAVIFQFFYFLPNGQIIISDVFGGRLMAPLATAAWAGSAASRGSAWPSRRDWLMQDACHPSVAAMLRRHAVATLLRQ